MTKTVKKEISPIVIRSYENLGSAIRRIRKLRGFSQTELAKKSGLRQATISNLERAKTSVEIETIILVFSALGLDMVIKQRPHLKNDNSDSLEGLF